MLMPQFFELIIRYEFDAAQLIRLPVLIGTLQLDIQDAT